MKTVYDNRLQFGERLRKLRHNAGLTLRQVEALTDVTFSIISAIECGEKAVGSDMATKLADAFNLTGEARDRFLIDAAGTRKKDRLVGYSRTLAPEIVNYVAKALVGSGIALDDIDCCQLRKRAANQDEQQSNDELVLGFKDGRNIVCGLVMTPGA